VRIHNHPHSLRESPNLPSTDPRDHLQNGLTVIPQVVRGTLTAVRNIYSAFLSP